MIPIKSTYLMDAIVGAIRNNHQALYQRCRGFEGREYIRLHRYYSVTRDDLCLKVHELKFGSKNSYMFDEVLELVYSEKMKTPLSPFWESDFAMTAYLNLTSFQSGNYTLAEFTNILFASNENQPPSYTFGYATTDPAIVDFFQAISSGPFIPMEIDQIKRGLNDNIRNVAKALQRGASHSLIAEIIFKGYNSWILDLYPLVFEEERVGKLFLDLSSHYNGPISVEMVSRVIGFKNFLAGLTYLSDRRVAMGKLLLMIYFPKSAQFIFASLNPMLAFRDILMGKLAEWRRDIAIKIDWGNDQMKTLPFLDCRFEFIENENLGYRENSMFDVFIRMLFTEQKYEMLVGTLLATGENPRDFFAQYRKNVIKREVQGIIYHKIRDKQDKSELIEPINLSSNKVILEFENKCVQVLIPKSRCPHNVWLRSKYIDLVSGTPLPLSRLAFDSDYSMGYFVWDYCQDYQESSVKAISRINAILSHYFQSQGRKKYPETWNSYAENCNLTPLLEQIWNHHIRNCNCNKSFGIITKTLEQNQIDPLTKELLLEILKTIIDWHYPTKRTLGINFNDWSISLKEDLNSIFREPCYRESYKMVAF